jgi:hypothetical protein
MILNTIMASAFRRAEETHKTAIAGTFGRKLTGKENLVKAIGGL